MSREYRLQELLKNPHIWRPGDFSMAGRSNVPSGFTELDRRLGGGWPVGVITEILLAEAGIGELGLVLPAVLHLGANDTSKDSFTGAGSHRAVIPVNSRPNRLAWIAPPYIPYAPALRQQGLDVSRILVVQPARQADALWAMEQALSSSICSAVLGWFTDIDDQSIRRLQLAAESTACWAVIFRSARFAVSASPAPLRVCIKPGDNPAGHGLDLQILRNRYGPVGSLSVPC